MAKKVARKKSTTEKLTAFTLVQEFLAFKRMKEELESQFTTARDALKKYVDEHGTPDDKGSLWLELDEEIGGTSKIKHERRVSVQLDTEGALELVRDRDLQDRLIVSVIVVRGAVDSDDEVADVLGALGYEIEGDIEERLDEDALYAAVYDDDANITADDIVELTKERESWALKVS